MSLPAHLSTLIITRFWLLLIPVLASGAEPALLARNGSATAGQCTLAGSNLTIAAVNLPLDQLVGYGGMAATPRWLEQGAILANGDQLRGPILGLQEGRLQLNSDLLGLLEVPEADVAVVALRPRLTAWVAPQGFTGALLANGDRLPGSISYIDELNVGIDNGRKVVPIARERVVLVILRATTSNAASRQVLRLANGDRIAGQLKAWGPAGFEFVSLRGTVRGANSEMSALWSESASQCPFTSTTLTGVVAGVGLDSLPDGATLVAGSRRYGHGLGIRGAARVSTQSDGSWTALVGEIAVLEGRATVRVMADDQPAWDSGVLSPGDAAKSFVAPATGAKQVRVEVIPTEAGASLVVVGWPTLVK